MHHKSGDEIKARINYIALDLTKHSTEFAKVRYKLFHDVNCIPLFINEIIGSFLALLLLVTHIDHEQKSWKILGNCALQNNSVKTMSVNELDERQAGIHP